MDQHKAKNWQRPPLHILLLSPHRDDAAFSLALSIAHWLSIGSKVTLLNVFTRSMYAPYSDAGDVHSNDRLGYVSALREREDESFLSCMKGLAMLDLNLSDAPVRLQCNASRVCEMVADGNDPAICKIRDAVAQQADARLASQAVVLPLAIGHHVDHCVVRDVLCHYAADLPTAFYEDLPYAARKGARGDLAEFRQRIEGNLRQALTPVLVDGTHIDPTAYKLRIAHLYASQIDGETAETVAKFSLRYGGAERLWVNDLWREKSAANRMSRPQHESEWQPLPE